MLSSTLRSVLSASEMAGFLTALLQAALLLATRKGEIGLLLQRDNVSFSVDSYEQ